MSDALQHFVSVSTVVTTVGALLLQVLITRHAFRRRRIDDREFGFGFAIEELRGRGDLAGIEEVVFHVLVREGDANVPELAVATRLTPDEVEAGLARLAELEFVAPSSDTEPTVWRPAAAARSKRPHVQLRPWLRAKGTEVHTSATSADEVDAEIDAALAQLGA